MRRGLTTGAALVAGIVVGALVMLAAQGVSVDQTTTTTSDSVRTSAVAEITRPAPSSTSPRSTGSSTPSSDQVLLVWTSGGLPSGLEDGVAALDQVTEVTSVRSGLAHLVESVGVGGQPVDQTEDGYVIPIELIAFDPGTYLAFLSKQESVLFAELGAGEIILGETSADLRRLEPGAAMTLEDGSVLTVSAVVPDVLIGAAEGAVPAGDAVRLGIDVERYLLVRHAGSRVEVEDAIRRLLPDGLAARIRAPGETPVLRHGDAVLPQVLIKEHFGEFPYRPNGDGTFDIPGDWTSRNIVTTEVPLLGSVTCHRNLIPALTGAMEQLEKGNLAFLVDPDGLGGCFNPRYIAGGRGISRHAWGAAIDINLGSNPEGLESAQDPRLIEVMERWGFTSGHDWLIPDPGHFEYVRPPETG